MFGVALPGDLMRIRIGRWGGVAKNAANDADVDKSAERAGKKVSVLFVCLGNICRSPTAEGVFRAALDRAGIADQVRTASAGLGDWHVGSPPDRRAIEAAQRRGYDLSTLRGRKVEAGDFAQVRLDSLHGRVQPARADGDEPADFAGHLGLLLDFAPETGVREVPDPVLRRTRRLRSRARSHRSLDRRSHRAPAADARLERERESRSSVRDGRQ